MTLKNPSTIEIPNGLSEAIRAFPVEREIEHCGVRFTVEPFDIYADCPKCHSRIKVRSFSVHEEIEDVFDAVLEWMLNPEAEKVARRRQEILAEEADE